MNVLKTHCHQTAFRYSCVFYIYLNVTITWATMTFRFTPDIKKKPSLVPRTNLESR